MVTSGSFFLPMQGFRWTGTYSSFQPRQGTGPGGRALCLGLSSLQLDKRAESGHLVSREGRKARGGPS